MNIPAIQSKIHIIRGIQVMLDFDLAVLYGVETKVLKQSVRRNRSRFPADFMFELNAKETEILRSQFVTSRWGGTRYRPFAFTEQGVAMLASILKSSKAIKVNISIVRAFVLMRQYALSHAELTERLAKLEERYNKKFKDIDEAIIFLIRKEQSHFRQQDRKRIGFKLK